MTDTHEKITPSSGCVFADLGVERPEFLDQAQKLADSYFGGSKTLVYHAALALSQAHQDGIREGKRQAAEMADAYAKELRKAFANDCARAVQGVRDDILSTITDESE